MKKRKDKTLLENNKTYISYFNRFMLMSKNMFVWSNLPPGVTQRTIENALIFNGFAGFGYDDTIGYVGLGGTYSKLNINDEPLNFMLISKNGYSKTFTSENCVPIFNNDIRQPLINDIELYAERLYNIQRTIDLNIISLRKPVIISSNDDTRLSQNNIIAEYEAFTPFIFLKKTKENLLTNFEVINLNQNYNLDKLTLLKHDVWNEACTFFGLANSNTDKKERLVEAEATSNNEQINMFREIMLQSRRLAVKQINEKFGLNIKVEFNTNVSEEIENDKIDEDDESGEEDE